MARKNEEESVSEKNIIIPNYNELKLISPFAAFIIGCTGSGKSMTILRWLRYPDRVFREKFRNIYYFYGSCHQKIFNHKKLSHVKFSNNMKLLAKLIKTRHPKPGILIVLDDLMTKMANDKTILDLYTKGSHHNNISVINVVQNIFFKSPLMVTLKENSQYYFVKLVINEQKIKLLATHIGAPDLVAAYNDSTMRDRYAGVLVDNNVQSNIRKLTRIRNRLTSRTPGLYISDKSFNDNVKKKVLKKIDDDNYFLDMKMLDDQDEDKDDT